MLKYPNKKKKKTTKPNGLTEKSKGMLFEDEINKSNEFYLLHDIAIIHKKPTPIKVTKVNVSKEKFNKYHKITEAYYEKKSTTDYNGIYKGKYIDFEAKQTKYKSFNLVSNLHNHQLQHLKNVQAHGGIAFILIYFLTVDKIFLLKLDVLDEFLKSNKNNSQIPLDYFMGNCQEIKKKYLPSVDYLKVIYKEYYE